MSQQPVFRSYLFVPGSRPERIPKALGAGADAVIVDLEDAVAPADKSAARDAVAKQMPAGARLLVRINGPDTPWFADDLRLCRLPGVSGVLLPKAEQDSQVREVAAQLGPDKAVLPLIETARGIVNAVTLAAVPQVLRFGFGSLDFQVDLGIQGDDTELLYFRSQLVLMSRLAGLQAPIDGVTVALDSPEQLRAETLRGKRIGFGGKLCIHPKQVPVVNACFRPTADEIAWAKRVVVAVETGGEGAVAVDGKMVDRPVMLQAEQILRDAKE